jgi:hypothetical protein
MFNSVIGSTMKIFIILFFFLSSCLYANEHRILISGFTKHEESHRSNGERFNEVNLGGGYEFTTFKDYNEFYFGTNLTVIDDSFDNLQYTVSASSNIRFSLGRNTALSIGVASFAMWKKDNFKTGVSEDDAQYDLVIGAAPLTSVYYKDLSVNFAYVPSISYKQIDSVGFIILYFGWRL